MRPIKFRALKDDMSNHKFVYGYLVYVDFIPRIIPEGFTDGITYHTCIKGTEGQFSGLLDKAGIEIYEHDIVTLDGYASRLFKIVWDSAGKFCLEYDEGQHNDYIPSHMIEIIGNVHEHSHLLNS